MTTAIVPVNAWAASLSIPQDLEPANSASIALYVQELANRLEYLRSRLPGATAPANAIDRFPALNSGYIQSSVTDWSPNAFASSNVYGYVWQQIAVAQTQARVQIPLDPLLQTGMVIKAMSIDYCGRNHGALPVTMPLLELYKLPRGLVAYSNYFLPGGGGSVAATLIDSQVDTSGSVVAFESLHAVSKTLAAAEAVDLANFSYVLAFKGEYGVNAQVQGFIRRPVISVTGV
jgi:hypothetical protein